VWGPSPGSPGSPEPYKGTHPDLECVAPHQPRVPPVARRISVADCAVCALLQSERILGHLGANGVAYRGP
jgi:hypothetical protein